MMKEIWDWIESWAMIPHSLYDFLEVTMYATGTALVILFVKRFFREQLSARWHLYIWTILLARLTIRPDVIRLESSFSLARTLQVDRLSRWIRMMIDSVRMNGSAGSAADGAAAGMNAAGAIGPGAVAGAVGDLTPTVEGMSFIGRGSNALYEVATLPVKESFVGPLSMENAFQGQAVTMYWILACCVGGLFVLSYLRLILQKKHWTLVGYLPKHRQTLNALEYQVYNCTFRVWEGDPKRRIDIYTAKGIDSPFVCGIFRRTLVLPEEMMPLDDSVILHELVHLKHHHLAFNWLVTGLRCLYFYNPILWYAFRKMQSDCELLCDERVLTILGRDEKMDHEQYGQVLLKAMGRGKSYVPGTTSLSNGQKNVLTRIRRIREFWKLSGASVFVALLLTVITGTYCLSIPQGTYGLDDMPTGFGFGTEVFDYNVYYAEKYQLSSPQEAMYGYGLALTGWDVGHEWLFLSDEERELRKEQKIENDEDGMSRLVDLGYLELMLNEALGEEIIEAHFTEDQYKDLTVDLINSRGDVGFNIYNFHRRTDGTYRGILRIEFNEVHTGQDKYYYYEDHDVILGIRDGRYQVLADRNQVHLIPARFLDYDTMAPELPYHAEIWEDGYVDYRMTCYETWKSRHGIHHTKRMAETCEAEMWTVIGRSDELVARYEAAQDPVFLTKPTNVGKLMSSETLLRAPSEETPYTKGAME